MSSATIAANLRAFAQELEQVESMSTHYGLTLSDYDSLDRAVRRAGEVAERVILDVDDGGQPVSANWSEMSQKTSHKQVDYCYGVLDRFAYARNAASHFEPDYRAVVIETGKLSYGNAGDVVSAMIDYYE